MVGGATIEAKTSWFKVSSCSQVRLNAEKKTTAQKATTNHGRFLNGTMEIMASDSILKKKNSYAFWIGHPILKGWIE